MSEVRRGGDGPTVAVVNDDRVSLTRMSGVLEGNGYAVLKYDSAEGLLCDESSAARSDLIITDLHMPDIDGWRLVRLLRSAEYATFNEVIPILVVSATFSGTDTEEISADIGADGFLSSPAPSDELLDQVAALLRGAAPRRSPRVLIVDDSVSLLQLLETAFADGGYLTETAETAAAAREALLRDSFDVVVIDYHLPDGTGDGLLEELRSSRPESAGIVITSNSDPRLAVSLMRAGAAGYLRKPFEPDHLLELSARARRERALLR
ncbi:MAG: response regulator, partial [Spirochaetes bacterium]|nr:response regulator [Spirochaetota bacterium]